MINILFEGMTSNAGGKETYILNTYKALDKKKYKSYFIAYDLEIAYESYLENTGATIIRVPGRNKSFSKYLVALKKIFKDYNFDVFWSHKTTLSSCEAMAIAHKKRIPVRIVHSHSSANMGSTLTYILHHVNKVLIKYWATEFLACSDTASKWFFGNKQSLIVRNAIDLESFRFNPQIRDKIRGELNLGNKTIIGHVGRFGVEKNHKKLLEVFKLVHHRDNNTGLILCGDGEEREIISNLIDELNLNDHVRLLGIVNNVNEIMQAMDVFVMPSLFEGLPFVLMEAQACGLKCVVSDTVSFESNIMHWNEFFPLSMSNAEWAEKILGIDLSYSREEGYKVLKEEGYDIRDNISIIEAIIEKGILYDK